MKKQEANVVSYGRPRGGNYYHQQVAAVTPMQSQFPQQRINRFPQGQQQRQPKRVIFDPIPMTYIKLYPSLISKNLVQPRQQPAVPKKLLWWYKPEDSCAHHQGASGHDLEDCLTLKTEVQRLIQAGILNIKDTGPNIKTNPMPDHAGASTSMVYTDQ